MRVPPDMCDPGKKRIDSGELTADDIKQQAARLKRASKKAPLLLSAPTGKGVTEAKRALLEIIDRSGGTTAARRRAEAPAWQP